MTPAAFKGHMTESFSRGKIFLPEMVSLFIPGSTNSKDKMFMDSTDSIIP